MFSFFIFIDIFILLGYNLIKDSPRKLHTFVFIVMYNCSLKRFLLTFVYTFAFIYTHSLFDFYFSLLVSLAVFSIWYSTSISVLKYLWKVEESDDVQAVARIVFICEYLPKEHTQTRDKSSPIVKVLKVFISISLKKNNTHTHIHTYNVYSYLCV